MTAAGPAGVGVAMLGYGAIAELHAVALAGAGARLLRIAGPKPAEATAFGARRGFAAAAATVDAAIEADGVELVVVASSSPSHVGYARRALAAGRHVLVEIPLALALEDGESLVALAAQRERLLGVCHTFRYSTPFTLVQAAIAETGARPRHVVARALSRRHENVGWTGRARSWTDDLLWHHGGHAIDAALTFLAAPVASIAASVGPRSATSGLPMDYAISLRTSDGGVASVALSYNSLVAAQDFIVIGDDETFLVTGAEARNSHRVLFRGDGATVLADAVMAQDTAFLAALTGGPRFPTEARAILPTLRVQEAVRQAMAGQLGGDASGLSPAPEV